MSSTPSNDTYTYTDEAGARRSAQPVVVLAGADGSANPYTLASNATIAPTTATTPVTGILRGTYLLDAQFTGASVQLQSLGADGTTWRNIGSALTQPGTLSVQLGQGSSIRLYNPNGSPLTGVYATLS